MKRSNHDTRRPSRKPWRRGSRAIIVLGAMATAFVIYGVHSSEKSIAIHRGGSTSSTTAPATRTGETIGTTTVASSVQVFDTDPAPTTTTTLVSRTTVTSLAATSPTLTHGKCRSGDPLANVYHPYRLRIVKTCLSVTGTVAYVSDERDGDVHVDLSLPSDESSLLDSANVADEYGNLVTEIVPADRPGCTPGEPPPLPPTAYRSPSYSYGICTGADLATPAVGTRVVVTGPYVLDSDHGWMEIHPVWSVVPSG